MKAAPETTTKRKRALALVAAFALAGVGTSVGLGALSAVEEGVRPPEPASSTPLVADDVLDPKDVVPWDEAEAWGDPDEWSEGGGWDDDLAPSDAEAEPLATFPVDGDRIAVGDASRDVAKQATPIWRRFTQLIPADQRTMLVGFELMPEQYGGAHVYPSERDPSRWIMGIGLGLGGDLDSTLIHEFGHLLTLQAKEVPPDSDERGCTTYFTGEGCALSGSTFAGFVDRFWPREMIEKVRQLEESGDWDAAGEFYEQHRDEFVTDYATTNPAEDLAETFTAFVTGERPTGSTIADQKVQYLWSDPDMVALRTRIRSGLSDS
jgi:hypothetical protein